MILRIALIIGLSLASPLARSAIAAEATARPNILFILIDDLGKEWIGCYDAEGIETPNIDALAAGGMKFTNAYCMPQCTPTRITLLTGQYPFRHGWVNHWDVPRWGDGCHFDPKLNTSYPRAIREAGYATCAAGKWQIDDFRVEPDAMNDAGFDAWCMWTGYEGDNPPSGERYQNPYIYAKGEPSKTYDGAFGPDLYCDYLIDFMKRHRDGGKPMFLYYPMALTHPPLVPTPDAPNAKGQIERHTAMVRYADKLIGRLVAALDELGLRKNTIVVVTTDNGTSTGIRGQRHGRSVNGAKHNMVEAGTAIPFIVNCPGVVPAGVTTDALTDFTDIAPTFVELAGAKLPAERVVDGQSIARLILGKANDSPRTWILSMGGGAATVRDGRVVPVRPYDERVLRDKRFKVWVDAHGRIEKLFDLSADEWEEHNLIDSKEPEHVAAIEKFKAIVATFPEKDAAPAYTANPPQKWDLRRGKKGESD